MKVYISGKITGIEYIAPQLFEAAEYYFRQRGDQVVNPMKLPHKHERTWKAYMREDLIALKSCSHIHFLDNWQDDSRGARIEAWFAKRYKIEEIIV